MKSIDDPQAWLAEWQRLSEGVLARAGRPADGRGGLEDAGAAFACFADAFARFAPPATGATGAVGGEDWNRFTKELGALAEGFVSGAFPAWPAPPGSTAAWSAALRDWSQVLSGIAADTARRFALRQAADPSISLRATFDRWIDCAEAAYQAAARSDAFVAAHARLVNEFVQERGRQHALLERGARAFGMPTRAEVDALHDAVRALREAAAAPAPTPRARAPQRAAARRAKRAPAAPRAKASRTAKRPASKRPR